VSKEKEGGQGENSDLAFSFIRGDALLRAQRAIGLVPAEGLGVGRRALALALFTWVPLVVWALIQGRALPGEVGEPLLSHFGIHARCLIAIPLFVIAEGVTHRIGTLLIPQLATSGIVSDVAKLREVLEGMARLRDRSYPWIVIAGLTVAVTFVVGSPGAEHELEWAGGTPSGFGAFWFRWVLRPIFTVLMLAWLWRLWLVFLLSARIARLDLSLVPTHPDRAGGLGFLELLPVAFSPVVFAISAVLSSRWAHDVVFHGVHVDELRGPMIAFAVVALLLFLSPLLAWQRPLAQARRRAEFEYGALVGAHGRLVRRRWIEGHAVGDQELLSAPEIGPVADTAALYDSARKMRAVPIGLRSLAVVLLPAAIPILGVLAIEIPIKDLLLGLLKTLA
jgi:hypothetical protein